MARPAPGAQNPDYERLSSSELRALCDQRGLAKTGPDKQLALRLLTLDQKKQQFREISTAAGVGAQEAERDPPQQARSKRVSSLASTNLRLQLTISTDLVGGPRCDTRSVHDGPTIGPDVLSDMGRPAGRRSNEDVC